MRRIGLFLGVVFLLQSCGQNEQRLKQAREKAVKDSIAYINDIKIKREQAIKDSITSIEQDKAIGEILFGIPEKEFKKQKEKFINKCQLPKYEFYKSLTIIYNKLGEYGFNSIYGWFHNDSLYSVELTGCSIEYDEYDRVMPDQYDALMSVLKNKYGEPTFNHGLPKWTSLEKGYFRRCAIWEIGNKTIEARVSCEGVRYTLNMAIFKPKIEERIRTEKQEKEKQSAKKATDLL